ncbi:MAG: hypothetical protein WCD47_13700 [Candidatus Sulfotelmatobacter sp.]
MIISAKTRRLAIGTGCLTSVAGVALGVGLGFALFAGILIIGAISQPRFHRLGRGLICAGAFLLSSSVFGIGFFMVTEKHLGAPIMTTEIVTLLSVLLVAVCDVAIVIDEIRVRRAEQIVERALTHESA